MSDTKKILEQYKNNEISLEEALLELKKEPFADIDRAQPKSSMARAKHQNR